MNALRILGHDTSGKVASCALLDTQQDCLLGEQSVYTRRGHSQIILPLCERLLADCALTLEDVDCYAVSTGPGSYTGLRIGIAAVQGLAMARGTPCIGVSTLEAMASRLFGADDILAVMHAREDKFYCARFSCGGDRMERRTPDELQSAAQIAGMTGQTKARILLVGDGCGQLMEQLEAMEHAGEMLRPVPPILRLQSAAGVCRCAAQYIAANKELPAAADLTASYLQNVNITKKG